MKMSKQLKAAYALRDVVADAVIDFETKNPGLRVVLEQEYSMDGPHRAQIGQLRVEIVAKDGTHKSTTYRSLTE